MEPTRVVLWTFWLLLFVVDPSDQHGQHGQHTHSDEHIIKHKGEDDSLQVKLTEFLSDLERNYCHKKDGIETEHNITDFASTMCPSIKYLLSVESENVTTNISNRLDKSSTRKSNKDKFSSPATWGYAILACLIISLVGLLAVAIIPLMHKVIYNHLLQFLVSLAIGSLSGDALLHLIPHAIAPHDSCDSSHHDDHNHHQIPIDDHHHHHHAHDDQHHHHDMRPIWLGLTALAGLFVFFIVERLVGYCSERKRKQNKSQKYMTSDTNATDGMMTVDGGGDRKDISSKIAPSAGPASCEDMLMVVHSSKDIKKMAYEAHEEMHKNCDTPSITQVNMVHSRGGHHHHSHEVPGSVAAVAWMVIVGDGFHNFADGIAIGSAFSSSMQDGLSTSIAIFCHELPHELGDFAMLLSAGMSGKQALVYNCVSSVLCFLGMCVGVGMGNLVCATPWVFMIVAGMFIYIALVDMLPEMKSVDPKTGEHPLLHLGLQVLGMLTGCSIMLIIALFENKIRIPL